MIDDVIILSSEDEAKDVKITKKPKIKVLRKDVK